MNVVRWTTCLVVGPVVVGSWAALFGCALECRASGLIGAPTLRFLVRLVWARHSVFGRAVEFLLLRVSVLALLLGADLVSSLCRLFVFVLLFWVGGPSRGPSGVCNFELQ